MGERSHLTDDPIDFSALIATVARKSDGAHTIFAGVVRDHHEGRQVESIVYVPTDRWRRQVRVKLLPLRVRWQRAYALRARSSDDV
jgi:molybdopterin synthase catalytic subunit